MKTTIAPDPRDPDIFTVKFEHMTPCEIRVVLTALASHKRFSNLAEDVHDLVVNAVEGAAERHPLLKDALK